MARPTPSAHAARLRDPAVQRGIARCEALFEAWHARIVAEAIRAEPKASHRDLFDEIDRRIAAQGL